MNSTLYWIIVWGSIIFIIFERVFEKRIIGFFGELWVKKELKKLNDEYKIINDVMIRTNDGRTHQIDHLVISKYGIFVIETKQYNAKLIGNDYDKKWIYKSYGIKKDINNPVHQNYGHMQALKEVLNIEKEKLISIVCISSRAILRIKSNVVVGIDKLLSKIKSYDSEIIHNVDEIYNQINSLNILDKKERKNHIQTVESIKIINDIESINKCPKCGGELVERNGIYGKFTGCSNYPKCKYTRN